MLQWEYSGHYLHSLSSRSRRSLYASNAHYRPTHKRNHKFFIHKDKSRSLIIYDNSRTFVLPFWAVILAPTIPVIE